jgi:large subunit ribosomal protein L15
MMIHEVTPKAGKYKQKKRLGRGIGSGLGKTAGRGTKGAGSRSGWTGSIRASREGGQTPLFMRLPKRGFSNFAFTTRYAVVNVAAIDARFDDGAEVNPDLLVKVGLIRDTKLPVKLLGGGETKKKLAITVAACTGSAKTKIEAAGGSVTLA